MKHRKKIIIFDSAEKLADSFVEEWKSIYRDVIKRKPFFSVALSGGRKKRYIYQKLSSLKDAQLWGNTHIFLVDERFVLPHAKDSNYRLIKESLLDNIGMPQKNVHPAPIRKTLFESSQEYESGIRNFFGLKNKALPSLDLVVLGIGEDGHTASLFPGDKALLEKESLVLPVEYDGAAHKRITLTLPVINNAGRIIFLAQGKNKALILEEILEKNNKSLPASLISPKNKNEIFFLDKEAASLLKEVA